MTEKPNSIPKLPTSAIQTGSTIQAETEHWFEYPVIAQPHHTDYGGVVWHGTYLTWMESARVECLRSIGVNFAGNFNPISLICNNASALPRASSTG